MLIKIIHGLTCLLAAFIFCACGGGNLNLIGRIATPAHHVKTGYRMLAMDKIEDAFREFNHAAGLSPKYAPAYIGISLVHAMRMEPEKGMASLKAADLYARGKDQELAVHVGAMRFFLIVHDQWKDNWLESVETAYRKALITEEDAPEPHYFMGRAYEISGLFDQAARQYYRVMEIGTQYLKEATAAYHMAEKMAAGH